MITIIDYEMGNLNSVEKALELALKNKNINKKIEITNDKDKIKRADAVILPGVGAFREAMRYLNNYDLVETLRIVAQTKPFLGICLGYQLMFDKSYEDSETVGLGLMRGEVQRFSSQMLKIPHMGWNKVGDDYYYFVHSYYVNVKEDVEVLYADYGVRFAAGVKKDNLWGFQFHPEKSQVSGIKILEQFVLKI
ncbi:MAG: imidazole glycerol phosphate synthase subunit HisH [bacterium]|nr:imidazole glycerol phosphate synthase subunit HisH [bacterium]